MKGPENQRQKMILWFLNKVVMKVMFIKDQPEHTKEEIQIVHNMNKGAQALLIIFHMDIKNL